MLTAFFVVLREAVEAFLIVAITLAYLRKTGRFDLVRSVFWGIGASILVSGGLGYSFWRADGINMPVWEGILGAVTVVLVASFVVHLMRHGPRLVREMEGRLASVTQKGASGRAAFLGVFLFTILMVSREGMEMALLLIQIQDPGMTTGIILGILAALGVAFLWEQFGYLLHMQSFFRVTSVFLLLFLLQVAVHSFHEFTEAGIFPASEFLHEVSEPFSQDGYYGKLYSSLTFFGCALWLVASWLRERWVKQPA